VPLDPLNIKIIYFFGQSPYLAQKLGAEVAKFLVEPFTVLGFEGQNWMLIVVGVIVAYVSFVWLTRDRR
jgi:H+/gluconate symporter-like permease